MDDKVGKVFNYVQEKILTGEWDIGDKITPEISLSKELVVSRSVVREAIKKFVALNILSRTQGGGTYVNNLTPNIYFNDIIPNISLNLDGYLEILEVRKALDPLAVSVAMANNCSILTAELIPIVEKMMEHKDSDREFNEWDMEFHKKIAECTDNELMTRLYDIISQLLKIHGRRNIDKDNSENQDRLEEHIKILNAIRENDIETAKIFSVRHVESSINEVKENM